MEDRKGGNLAPARPNAPAPLPGERSAALAKLERLAFAGGAALVGAGFFLKFLPKFIMVFGVLGLVAGVAIFVLRRLAVSDAAMAISQREVERARIEAGRARFADAKKALYSVEATSPARPMAMRALAQIDTALDLEKTFSELIARKFEAGELTQERYANTAGNAIEALTANIVEAAQRIRRAAAADPAIEKLLTSNDKALEALAAVNGALASIRTTKEGTTASLDAAITDLTELAARAKLYDGRE